MKWKISPNRKIYGEYEKNLRDMGVRMTISNVSWIEVPEEGMGKYILKKIITNNFFRIKETYEFNAWTRSW